MKKLCLLLIALTAVSPLFPAISEVQNVYVQTDRAKLFCRSMGKGAPIIVLHGGPGLTHDYLLPHLEKLAENHFVIFYDQRGGGKSEGELDAASISVDVFINDLEAIRKHFGLKKVSILGHSWGGFLAMHYAISHPEAIDKLILCSTMPCCSKNFARFIEEYTRRLAPFTKELDEIRASKEFTAGDPKTTANYLRIIFRTYCARPEKVDELRLELSPQANQNFFKISEIFRRTVFSAPFDLKEGLEKVTCNTLIIQGDQDPVPVSAMQMLHGRIKNSKLVVIKECGHFPYMEKTQEFFGALNDFFAKS